MSSTLGDKGSALVSSYAATKAFDTVLAKSLENEFQTDGMDVLACVAAPIETPNFRKANGYDTKELDFILMQPQDVAKECLNALGNKYVNGDESIEILYTIIANSCHGGWNE
ncbi:oxidoreductase, short-chain dehydrogenase/reductase family protein [Chaetoceros tenuissimus]|uniref:Oxidoreductase, short-chain dehydrogenase/reductase family protein n=1 Tax=Chaetoceros tenuissimus TaxID=426638 RepID=A0AAD3CZL5_9STRA|nr:oxidoreductase, short-chain dehydrogenase/reductase family protein [Chaetoceros tenuissimus]